MGPQSVNILPAAADLETYVNVPQQITLHILNPICFGELNHHIETYISNYYTPTWNFYSDMSYIIEECKEVFNDFLLYTFERDQPEIFIEVYLDNPVILSDSVKLDICRLVMHGLHISISPTEPINHLLIYYTYALAVYNEWYFINRIATNIEPGIILYPIIVDV